VVGIEICKIRNSLILEARKEAIDSLRFTFNGLSIIFKRFAMIAK
jgi:hypothetical protein